MSQIRTKVILHYIIMIHVTTRMSENLKNCYHGYKNSTINTQVKDHIPLKTAKKLGTLDLSKFENKKMNVKSTSLLYLG